MKNGKVKVFALISALLLAVCAFAVAACDFTFRTKELTKIEVDSSNVQKVYHPGDDFDENAVKRALVVTAYYDDDTHAKINSSGFRVVPVNIDHLTTEETQTAGRDTVKVVYGEHESSYDVTITEVTSLRVDAGGLDVSFRQDESHTSGEIDHDGLKVYLVYNDGSEELLPADKYTVTADLSKAGNAKATVTTIEEVPVFERGEKDVITGGVVYKQFTAEYDINVIAHNLTKIKFKIDDNEVVKNYFVGDPFDSKGIAVWGEFTGEADKRINEYVTFKANGDVIGKDFTFTTAGDVVITATVNMGDHVLTTEGFTVTVTAIAIEEDKTSLTGPTKASYFVGDEFEFAGITMSVKYNNEEKPVEVTYPDSRLKVEVDGLNNNKLTKAGEISVTVTYTDDNKLTVTKTATITVTAVEVSSIAINEDSKHATEFYEGDAFSAAGLVIDVTYNNETTTTLNYDEKPEGLEVNAPTMSVGTLQVTVSYGGKEVTYEITVTAIAIEEDKTSLTVPEKEGGYFVGDKFDITAIKLHVVYNHGDPKDVNGGDAGVEVTVKGLVDGKLTESGEISISVTYTDDNKLTVTKKATINVTAIAITEIDVDTSSVKKEGYFVGDTFDPADLKATVKYNNSEKPVEVTYPDVRLTVNFTEPVNGKFTAAGDAVSVTVKVTFKDDANRTTSKDVTIENVKVTPIKIDSVTVNATALDGKTFARDGSDYDFTGLTFSVKYNNKAEAETVDFATAKKNGTTFTASDEISAKNTRTITVNFKDANGLEYKPETPLTFTITVEAEKPKKSVDSFIDAILESNALYFVVNTTGYTLEEIKADFSLHFGETDVAVNDGIETGEAGKFKLHTDGFKTLADSKEGTKYVVTAYLNGEKLDISLIGSAHAASNVTMDEKLFSLSVEDDNLVLTVTTKETEKSVSDFGNATLLNGNLNFYFNEQGWDENAFAQGDVKLLVNIEGKSKQEIVCELPRGEKLFQESTRIHVNFVITSITDIGEHALEIQIQDKVFPITGLTVSNTYESNNLRYSVIEKEGRSYLKVEDANKPQTFAVTVNVVDGSKGETGTYQLTKKDGGDTVTTGSEVEVNTKLTLTVTPDKGVKATVSATPSEALKSTGENSYEITVTAATTITITFASATEEPEIPEITVYDVYNASFVNNGILQIFIRCNGIDNDTTKAKAAFKLLVGDKEVEAENDVAQEGDHFILHYNLLAQNLAANTYTITVKVNSKTPFERDIREGNSTYADTANNKTYTIKVVDGHLQLTVTDKVEIKLDDAYNATLESNNGKLTVYIRGNGIANEQVAKDTFTLHVEDGLDIAIANLNDVTKGDVYYSLKFDLTTLAEKTYNNVSIKYGEGKLQAISSVTSIATWTDTKNNKVYTISAEGRQLTLTVAAAKPVADGTQDHPFSVSDIVERTTGLKQDEFYTENGEAARIYIKGIVKNPGELNYDNKTHELHGVKNIYITPINDSAVAAIASDVELLVYCINWGGAFTKPATDYNPLKAGDIIVVYGYVKNYKGTVEVCQDSGNKEWPTLFTWENSDDDKEVDDWLAEIEKNLTPDGGLTADYTAPNPVRPKTVTVELVITDGDTYAEVLDKTTLHIKEYPAEGSYTVKVTVKVTVGEKTSERSVTVTINPQVKTETVVVEYVFTNLTAQGAEMDLVKFKGANTTPKNEFLTAATFNNAVDGNSSGGDYYGKEKGINLIKIGSNNNSGKIELTFSENVIQVVLNCATWQKSQTNKIQVNAVSKDLPQTKGKLTFDIAETKTVTISTAKSNRGFIFSMEFTFNKTPLTTAQKKAQVQEVIDSLNVADTMSKSEPLPTTDNVDVKLSWRSDNADVIDVSDGVNFNVSQTDKEEKVTVTVTGIYNDEEATKIEKTFTITIPAKGSEPEVQTWKLVTQESQLSEGAQVVFTSGSKYCTSTGSGRFSEGKETFKLSADKNTITTLPSDIAIWTVGGAANGWTFYIKGGYLSQKGTTASTSMELAKTVTSNSQWTLHSASNNAWGIKSNAYSSGSRYFSYNSQGGYFAAYAYQNISIYVLA